MPCARRWADYADDTDDDGVPPAKFSISIQKLMAYKHDEMSQRKVSQVIWSRFQHRLHSALQNDSIWHLSCGFNLAVALCMFAYKRLENNGVQLPEHHAFVMHIFKGIRRFPYGEKFFAQFYEANKISFYQMILIAELLSNIYPLGFVLAPAPEWGRCQRQLVVRKTGFSWSLEQYSPTVHLMRTLQFYIS